MSIPDIWVPSDDLGDYVMLLFGEKNAGKTTLAARYPNSFFFMFEPSGRALRIRQYPRPSKGGKLLDPPLTWNLFTSYIDLLEGEEDLRTVVVDTLDRCYDACMDHVCLNEGMDHPGEENDYGASWKKVSREFEDQLNRLLSLGKGVIFTSHMKRKEIEKRRGGTYEQAHPTATGQALKFLDAVVDIPACYEFNDRGERELTIRGKNDVWGSCRLEEHFVTPGGKPIDVIPMGNSPDEAYANFLAAFNNTVPWVSKQKARKKKSLKRRAT